MIASLAATLQLALAAAGAAPDAPWSAEAPFQAEPGEVARAAAALDAPADADVDVLLDEVRVVFDAEGRASTTWRLVFRPLTREAAGRWAEVLRVWTPWHEARPQIRARVIGVDGAVHALDPATLVESGLGSEDPLLYGDRRALKGPLPAVEAGAVVEEEAVVADTQPLFEAGTVRRFGVGRDGPVREVRVRVEAPRGLPLQWRARGGLDAKPVETGEGGRRVLSVRWGPVAPVARPEPLAPPDRLAQPHLAVSTGASWRAVASAYARVVDRQLEGADLGATAAEVVPRGASRLAAAQAVLDWVRGRTRYTGLELGQAALVPARPAETLRRRYGDCKDLALLVAGVLRAAGHPATLALVRARWDDPADLPGLGEFDHAVVAVPAAGAEPALFLDATDPQGAAGELAGPLQGRLALVASPATAGLTRLPELAAERNRVEVTREITLPESGWSDAVEVQALTGWPASVLRAQRGAVPARDLEQADQALVAGHFVDADGGEASWEGVEQAGGPLRLRLTARGSRWGITRADDAEAVVSPGFLLEWLPPSVKPAPEHAEGEAPGRAAAAAPPEPAVRRGELLLPIAYQGTLRYRVVPPAGFEPELPLPDPQRTVLGPLAYERRAEVSADGAVVVVHTVAVTRRRLAPAEVEGLRAGLAALLDDGPRVRFVRTSARLLEAGQGREALDEIRRLIALHEGEARHWNHLAQALLRLGLGEAARSAARRSVALEPGSGWSQRVLASALEHDALGRWLAPGCDLDGAIEAQRRAVDLDREPGVRAHLAFLLEHGARCERYGEGARLEEAASAYRYIRTELKSRDHDPALLAVLLRSGKFAEALPLARDLPEGRDRKAALLACRAATEGAEAAVKEALRQPAGERAPVLDAAAQHLVLARRYAEAARLLDAGSAGTSQSAELKARAAQLARVRRVETLHPDPKDPATFPVRFLRALAQGGEAWAAVPEVDQAGVAALGAGLGGAIPRGLRTSSGLPEPVALDVGLSLLEVRREGDGRAALRLGATLPGQGSPLSFVLLREPAGWRLLTAEPPSAGLGAAARRRLEAGDQAGARGLLALARLEAGEPGEGRPAALLATLLPEGREPGAEALAVAAAGLEAYAGVDPVRGALERARAAATAPDARKALTWALAAGHARAERWADVVPLAEALLEAEPASERAFVLLTAAQLELGRRADLEAAVARRLALLPDDPPARHALVSRAIRAGDVAAAVDAERALVEGGRADPGDRNNLAWALLFVPGPLPEQALEEARRAVEQTREREPASLHTLATVHAVRGEAAEAMQVLRKAVEQGGAEGLPGPDDWLVVGLILERYGLVEEARAALARVRPPERPDGLSAFELAARHLQALPPARPPPSASKG